MLRTEYYIVNHVKDVIMDGIEKGLIDAKSDELPQHEFPDSFYVSVLKFVEYFLNRHQCTIDALEFFENYEDIRGYIVNAIDNPDEATVPAAVLASTEFGKQIARCKTAYHIFMEEFKICEYEEYKKQLHKSRNNPYEAFNVPPWAQPYNQNNDDDL